VDSRLAREIYLDALSAALFAGRLSGRGGQADVAQAALAAPAAPLPPRAPDLLLEGFARLVADGHAAGAPVLQRALRAFHAEELSMEECIRWGGAACTGSCMVWDYESWDAISARLVRCARDAGALSALPIGLTTRAGAHLLAGEHELAASLADEVPVVNEVTGSSLAPYAALTLVAFQGRQGEASELIETTTKEVIERGELAGLSLIRWVTAVLHNGLGHYDEALAAVQKDGEQPHTSWWRGWGLVELVEAGVRSGRTELAADALRWLTQATTASGTDWAVGIENRSRALLTDGNAAETLYQQAIEALERTRVRVDLARACLLYGEWLRRERRRVEAREQLRRARDSFIDSGMEAFAERARVELEATGERARKRIPETRDDLTPQEAQISRLAAEGATNQEIAAQLFISPSTVDYHLRKAFRKLGVRSRTQLARQMLQPGARPEPADREN
jgi:DNA-binding CsgD family transcriptional regulator